MSNDFDPVLVRSVAVEISDGSPREHALECSFFEVCRFLSENKSYISWRGNDIPGTSGRDDLMRLADRYFRGFRLSDFPKEPRSVPDEMVSVILQVVHSKSADECNRIKEEHQMSMSAENCVGALLERYLDSVLWPHGWHWCCGNFVRAVDFIKRNDDGSWLLLQVKNRDNTENSSSSAIRNGTQIQKWFRSFSHRNATNWNNLPESMQGFGLSENGFETFVRSYLSEEINKNPS